MMEKLLTGTLILTKKSSVTVTCANLKLYIHRPGCTSRSQRISQCCNELRHKLMELNTRKKLELDDHLGTAVTNFMANIQWRFLNPNGPRIEKVTKDEPLMNEYVITY